MQVRGDSVYADWFPLWLLDVAETYGAVIFSANYRFLPEVTGTEILDDVDDFWDWIHSETPGKLLREQRHEETAAPIELDLDRIITAGDSAGGLLSVYLTLSHPDKIRAGTAAYPSLSWDIPPLLPPKRSENVPPESMIDEYLANLKPGYVESSDLELRRVQLSMTITAYQRGYGFFLRGASELPPHRQQRLYQLSRLDKPGAKLPPGGLVIIHGTDDTAVLPAASQRFVKQARERLEGRQGADKIALALRPGPHGFDVDVSLKERWLADALKGAIDAWLE